MRTVSESDKFGGLQQTDAGGIERLVGGRMGWRSHGSAKVGDRGRQRYLGIRNAPTIETVKSQEKNVHSERTRAIEMASVPATLPLRLLQNGGFQPGFRSVRRAAEPPYGQIIAGYCK